MSKVILERERGIHNSIKWNGIQGQKKGNIEGYDLMLKQWMHKDIWTTKAQVT